MYHHFYEHECFGIFKKKDVRNRLETPKKLKKKTLPDGRWNAFESDEDEGEELGLVCSISDFARARQGVGMPVVQSTRPTVMIIVATMATTTVGKGGRDKKRRKLARERGHRTEDGNEVDGCLPCDLGGPRFHSWTSRCRL